MSTHRISDFQVLALTGNIRYFKSVVLFHFLHRETEYKYQLQTCHTYIHATSLITEVRTNLGLELHDLELFREVVKFLVDVHHAYRSVQNLSSLGVHFLFTTKQQNYSN